MTVRGKLIGLAAFALAGCGGGGDGDGSGIDPRLARLDIYESQKLRVLGDPEVGAMGIPLSGADAMPDGGSVNFTGFVSIRVETATTLVLFGDATVGVIFGTDQFSGQLDSFFGNDSSGQIVDYAGMIAIDGGSIGGSVASDLALDYEGVLTAANETLVFDGITTGSFLGAPISAITTSDLEAVVDYNGAPMDATLLILAETVP